MTRLSHHGPDDPAPRSPVAAPSSEPATTVAEVALTGELDLSTYEQAHEQLVECERSRPQLLIIDLATLEFMDSTGVRLVLQADQRARDQGRRVAIRLGSGSARRVFQTLGLLDTLAFVPDLDGAAPDGQDAS